GGGRGGAVGLALYAPPMVLPLGGLLGWLGGRGALLGGAGVGPRRPRRAYKWPVFGLSASPLTRRRAAIRRRPCRRCSSPPVFRSTAACSWTTTRSRSSVRSRPTRRSPWS